MSPRSLLALLLSSGILLALSACDSESAGAERGHTSQDAANPQLRVPDQGTPPEGSRKSPRRPSPGSTTRALLAQQRIGRQLLGRTVKMVEGAFQAVDLSYAPERYLLFYSASW
jgi:hypothetical protein